MSQYDVYRNPSARLRGVIPYVLILQSDAVSSTSSVIAAGLTPHLIAPRSRLFPAFVIGGRTHILLTPDLASIPRELLSERIMSLAGEWNRITAALDILFTGA